ncbi:MAG TPA: class I SAM-dependent methyltransferase [Candidatus Omnitrophica bacterium]|nr:MAG: methyltransferase type 11 [Omnitrophica WOR_2 bacterium GWA2_45_18]HBR15504.1 class I SAM-dependent methyltransferase [Candidatus Omnitrophota bacterium]
MKGRESGMPEQRIWENFFDTEKILTTMNVDPTVNNAAEFGCGYGTFTLPAARRISGTLYAFDIDPDMIETTQKESLKYHLENIQTILRDFLSAGTGLGDETVDYVMLFNILHVEHPQRLLAEAWRILKPAGRAGIIHWNYDPATPRGPSMEIRPKPDQCIQWAQTAGFSHPEQYDLKPYHYGITVVKERTK